MPPKHILGLALSGGGYRAAAFHLGTLRALHNLGVLEKVDVFSTISGGSITGAAYCLQPSGIHFSAFDTAMTQKLGSANVIRSVLTSWYFLRFALMTLILLGTGIYLLFTPWAWLFLVLLCIWFFIILKAQFALFPAGKAVEAAYDQFFFDGASLTALRPSPILAIGSSNLETGRPFTFSREYMGDSTYTREDRPPIDFTTDGFPIARAVVASSCVPFAFTPVSIAKKFLIRSEDSSRIDPRLVDGGVFDNQGIQKLTQSNSRFCCDTVIVSDAGGKFRRRETFQNTLTLLIRTVDLFMVRIKNFQMTENVYQNGASVRRQIAYLSLGWNLDRCIPGFFDNMKDGLVLDEVLDAHGIEQAWRDAPDQYRSQIIAQLERVTDYPALLKNDLDPDQLKVARSVGTNLTPLSAQQLDFLARQAENLTTLQVRLYCPKILKTETHGN